MWHVCDKFLQNEIWVILFWTWHSYIGSERVKCLYMQWGDFFCSHVFAATSSLEHVHISLVCISQLTNQTACLDSGQIYVRLWNFCNFFSGIPDVSGTVWWSNMPERSCQNANNEIFVLLLRVLSSPRSTKQEAKIAVRGFFKFKIFWQVWSIFKKKICSTCNFHEYWKTAFTVQQSKIETKI